MRTSSLLSTRRSNLLTLPRTTSNSPDSISLRKSVKWGSQIVFFFETVDQRVEVNPIPLVTLSESQELEKLFDLGEVFGRDSDMNFTTVRRTKQSISLSEDFDLEADDLEARILAQKMPSRNRSTVSDMDFTCTPLKVDEGRKNSTSPLPLYAHANDSQLGVYCSKEAPSLSQNFEINVEQSWRAMLQSINVCWQWLSRSIIDISIKRMYLIQGVSVRTSTRPRSNAIVATLGHSVKLHNPVDLVESIVKKACLRLGLGTFLK